MEKNLKRIYIHIYVKLNHFAVHQKLTHYKSTILQLKSRESQRLHEQAYSCLGGRDSWGVCDELYKRLHLKWMTNKSPLFSKGNSAQCYVVAWMGGESGEEWIYADVRLSPFAIHLKLS